MTDSNKMTREDLDKKDVTNTEIFEFLKQFEEEQKKIVILTPEEVGYLKGMIKERQAYSLVFSKGKVLLGMLAATILVVTSFLVDWKHLFPKVGGG